MSNYQSGKELTQEGYTPCNDADLNTKVFDLYDSTHIALNDKEGNPQLFVRHGNDYFSHVKPLVPEGVTA